MNTSPKMWPDLCLPSLEGSVGTFLPNVSYYKQRERVSSALALWLKGKGLKAEQLIRLQQPSVAKRRDIEPVTKEAGGEDLFYLRESLSLSGRNFAFLECSLFMNRENFLFSLMIKHCSI